MGEWVTVLRHRGFEIKVMNGATEADEQGYKVDSWVVWHKTLPTVAEAVALIDDIMSDPA